MFDFLDNDWFVIGLEIFFLILIGYDVKRYIETKKREYIVNIVLTIGFFVWTMLPFYKSYFEWSEQQKEAYKSACETKEHNATLCTCISSALFKEYGFDELQKEPTKEQNFVKEQKGECLDDSWF